MSYKCVIVCNVCAILPFEVYSDWMWIICINYTFCESKTDFVTDPTIKLPEKHGSVVDLCLNHMICLNMIIHCSMPVFENGINSAAMLFRKISSGICREVSLSVTSR